jgi:hypothetical protein
MIFISHAWNNGQPDPKVLQFVDFLRKNGYDAKCDIIFQQEKTAIHFTEMMADALRQAEKIVIILSEDYKVKADNFQGGVGIEYKYIIEDFAVNENRYVIVSFNGRERNIIPDFLRGRDIVDLCIDEKNEYRELFSKMSGVAKYQFSPVSEIKTTPTVKSIEDFHPVQKDSLAEKLNLTFTSKPLSDIAKKRFLKDSFDKIIKTLNIISKEFCEKYPYFQIECDVIDNTTTTFEIYKNEKRIRSIQIWFGNLMGSAENGVFIGESIGSKNSYSEMIVCKEIEGQPTLYFNFGFLMNNQNTSIEEAIKQIWESKFQVYLRAE